MAKFKVINDFYNKDVFCERGTEVTLNNDRLAAIRTAEERYDIKFVEEIKTKKTDTEEVAEEVVETEDKAKK